MDLPKKNIIFTLTYKTRIKVVHMKVSQGWKIKAFCKARNLYNLHDIK